MKRTIRFYAVIAVIALIVAPAAYSRGRHEQSAEVKSVQRPVGTSVETGSTPVVIVLGARGSIRISGSNTSAVTVGGTVGADIAEVRATETGDGEYTIEAVLPDVSNFANLDIEVNLTVAVPREAVVRASGIAGSYDISDVHGGIDVETLAGSVRVTGAQGNVTATTIGGDVSVEGPAARVTVVTATGDIEISGVHGVVAGRTTAGAINIRDSVLSEGSLQSDLGSVTMDCDLTDDARIQAVSRFGGSISLLLPSTVQGRFTVNAPANSLDLDAFAPDADISWVYPITDVGSVSLLPLRRDLSSRIGRALPERSGGRWIGEADRTSRGEPGVDGSGDVTPRILSIGGTLQEFTVGDGGARVYLSSQFAPPRSEEERANGTTVAISTKG